MRPPKGISVYKRYKVLIENYHWLYGKGRLTIYINGKELKRIYEDNRQTVVSYALFD